MLSRSVIASCLLFILAIVTSCSSIIEDAIPELKVVGDLEIIEIEFPSTVTIPIVGIPIGSGDTPGKLVFRLPIEAYNKNSSPLKITKLEYDIFLRNNLLATGVQDNRVDIGANGRSRFDVDITVPIDKALAASPDLIAFASGTAMPVKVDVKVTVDILGITKVSLKQEVFNQVITAPPIEDLPIGLPF